MSPILPRKSIFCNEDKYLKGCRMCEKLSSCIQIRADEKIRKMLTERNDTTMMTIDNWLPRKLATMIHVIECIPNQFIQRNCKAKLILNTWESGMSDLFDRPEVVPF